MLLGRRDDLSLHRCATCRFVSGQPALAVSPEISYRDYYHAPPPPAPEARYHEWLDRAESEVGIGRLLEIGAGGGAFAAVGKARGWQVNTTEVSETGARALAAAGVKVFVGDSTRLATPIRASTSPWRSK